MLTQSTKRHEGLLRQEEHVLSWRALNLPIPYCPQPCNAVESFSIMAAVLDMFDILLELSQQTMGSGHQVTCILCQHVGACSCNADYESADANIHKNHEIKAMCETQHGKFAGKLAANDVSGEQLQGRGQNQVTKKCVVKHPCHSNSPVRCYSS